MMTHEAIKSAKSLMEFPEVFHVVKDIKRGIELCRDAKIGGAMLKLIYCGIDVMAYLSMPKRMNERQIAREQAKFFKLWVDKYLKFLHPVCKGSYIWEARNGLLHTHSAESVRVKKGEVPRVYYRYKGFPYVKGATDSDGRTMVLVSMEKLIDELFSGIDSFVLDQLAREESREIVIERCEGMLMAVDRFGNFIESE